MENQLTRWVYDRSPAFIQDLWASAFGLQKRLERYGGRHDEWASFFTAAHRWSVADLRAYQAERLGRMLAHCYENVPFYRERFDRLKLRPSDIRGVDDLPLLPILDKTELIGNRALFAPEHPGGRGLRRLVTSGSTGTPLHVYWTNECLCREFAFVWSRWRPGIRRGDPYASFTGLELVPPGRTRPPFWRNNWPAHQRMYSIFHMSEQTLPAYVDSLNARYNKYLTGYASAVYQIARFMEQTGRKLDCAPQAFFAASEELQPEHRETIERVFGCRVWNRYGLAELVASVTQYECGHLHEDMDFAIMEFVEVGREDGLVRAQVVGTTMTNYAWPLIRYRTGDEVLLDPTECCGCGVPGRVIRQIHGRTGMFFELANGARVTNISVIAKKCRNIRLMQVVQDVPGSILVRVVRGTAFAAADEKHIIEEFRRKIGAETTVEIEYVNELERTKAGKTLSIINRWVKKVV